MSNDKIDLDVFFEEMFKDKKDQHISAFAYSIGRMLNTAIKTRTGNIIAENEHMKERIVSWRMKIIADDKRWTEKDVHEYDEFFGIM